MTNANVLPPSKRPALLWAIACLLMLGVLLTLLPQARLNSSVLAMLPNSLPVQVRWRSPWWVMVEAAVPTSGR